MIRQDESNGLIICWIHESATFFQIYHVLLANSSLLQVLLVIFINIALVMRLRQSALLRESMLTCTSANREIAASMLLVIMSSVVVICALPQSVAYTLSTILVNIFTGEEGQRTIRMTYNVSDLGWQLLFLQMASNWIVYMKRMKNFRRANMQLLACHWHIGKGRFDDKEGSLRYFSTHVRNLTSDNRILRKPCTKLSKQILNKIKHPDAVTRDSGAPDLRQIWQRGSFSKTVLTFQEEMTISTKF